MHREPHASGEYPTGTSMVALPPHALLPAEPVWHSGPPAPPEILTSGMDPLWLWHSLRRRWLLAVGVGIVAALLTALLVWLIIPATAQATAVLKVDSMKPVVFRRVDEGESDYDTYRRTLAGMFKTQPVLAAALKLNNGELPKLETLEEVEPIEQTNWLSDNLQVTFPDKAELMQVSMSGSNQADLVKMVNAVTEAFLDEVIYKEKQQRLQNRDTLKRSYVATMSEITLKTRAYYALSRELYSLTAEDGAQDRSLAFKAHRSLAATDLDFVRKEIESIKKSLFELTVELTLRRAQRDDPAYMAAVIDKLIAEDPQVQMYRQQLTNFELVLAEEQARSKRADAPSILRYQQQRNSLAQRMNQREAELRPQLQTQIELTPNIEDLTLAKGAEVRKRALEARLEDLNKQHSEKILEIKRLEERSLDLDVMATELEQMKELARDMGNKIETLQVEIDSPDRVQQVQSAELRPGLNRLQRGILIAFGGLLGVGLSVFGIAVWEFQSRRLYSPNQLEHGLGIRVLGELPPLADVMGGLDESQPEVVMLLESIDSLRTTLMHLSHSNGMKVFMITGASEGEGRTTVASQLAASLARTGKRTVLVDADMRHPSLHHLFDLPLSAGLCELLRGETELARALRPTAASGLWAISAGEFDAGSIQALSQDQLAPIIARLRADFDYVILDASPVLSLADALIVGQYADGAILSTMRDFSQVPNIYAASERLQGVGVQVLGAVVNGMPVQPHTRAMRLGLSSPAIATEEIKSS